MPILQQYFELRDARPLQSRPWMPLRLTTDIDIDPPEAGIVKLREYIGIATAAIYDTKRTEAEKLGWSELGAETHRSGMEQWGYRSCDIFRGWSDGPLGINLVIDQHLDNEGLYIWHLHPDLIVALRLFREGDYWFRPEEGWAEVARLKRDGTGRPVLLEIKAEFLADYLAARGMALYCSSYWERTAISTTKPPYSWPDDNFHEQLAGRNERDHGCPMANGMGRTGQAQCSGPGRQGSTHDELCP